MMPTAIDFCCCAGGATKGLMDAGFYVIGVDTEPQPHYIGHEFIQGDALAIGPELIRTAKPKLNWGSPPCQRYTKAQIIQGNEHPDLIPPMRQMFIDAGVPYIIENVVGAPLIDPVELCGCMFPDLNVYRTRLFETSFPVRQPPHAEHLEKMTKMGRPPVEGERMHVVGNFSGVAEARKAMGIDWMVRGELREAIPPAYSYYLAEEFIDSEFSR